MIEIICYNFRLITVHCSSDQEGTLDFVRVLKLAVQVDESLCLLWSSNDGMGGLQVHEVPVVVLLAKHLFAKMVLLIEISESISSCADSSHDLAAHLIVALLVSRFPDLSSEFRAFADGTGEGPEQAKVLEVERGII